MDEPIDDELEDQIDKSIIKENIEKKLKDVPANQQDGIAYDDAIDIKSNMQSSASK